MTRTNDTTIGIAIAWARLRGRDIRLSVGHRRFPNDVLLTCIEPNGKILGMALVPRGEPNVPEPLPELSPFARQRPNLGYAEAMR